MPTKNEQKWWEKYEQLRAYVMVHRHLPDKKKVENRGLLNWWKYNKKMMKQGGINKERLRLLKELSDLRSVQDQDLFGYGEIFREI